MSKKLSIIFFAIIASMLFSCKTQQVNLTYFGDVADGTVIGNTDYAIKIVPDDELIINVTSVVPEATEAYNMPMSTVTQRTELPMQATQKQYSTYLVDNKGYITMPVLGKLLVAGKSTYEIEQQLTEMISKSVDNPVVKVQLVNFRVNVIGEVNTPSAVEVKRERFSVLDAIAAAGDLSIYGLRDNVYVLREDNGVKTFHKLNLNDANVVASPYFYLRQNDVVYVAPNKIRVDNSRYNQNNAYKLTVVSTIVSAASVLASLVIALVVK